MYRSKKKKMLMIAKGGLATSWWVMMFWSRECKTLGAQCKLDWSGVVCHENRFPFFEAGYGYRFLLIFLLVFNFFFFLPTCLTTQQCSLCKSVCYILGKHIAKQTTEKQGSQFKEGCIYGTCSLCPRFLFSLHTLDSLYLRYHGFSLFFLSLMRVQSNLNWLLNIQYGGQTLSTCFVIELIWCHQTVGKSIGGLKLISKK